MQNNNYMNPMGGMGQQNNAAYQPMAMTQQQGSQQTPLENIMRSFGQAPAQPTGMILGRMINSIDEVFPNEVQMDGNIYFFPMRDYSCVYAKVWTKDATLKEFKFIPEKPVLPQVQTAAIPEDFRNDVMTKLERIESILTPKTEKGAKASG